MMQQQQAYSQQGTQQQYQPTTSNQEEAFIAGPRYIPPPAQGEANNSTCSTTSAHTLVDQSQSNSHNPTYPASNAEIVHSNGHPGVNGVTQPAHPLQDTQEAADRFGKIGAMGIGVANAAAAKATAAPQHEQESGAGMTGQSMPSYQPGDSTYIQPQEPRTHSANLPLSMQTQVHYNTAVPQHGNQHDTITPKVHREPPLTLPLHPNTRYCTRCEIVKPYRTHHCRHCGKCILGMDHHCPWIGQCVGARNHVFFVGFCFWACVSVFLTLFYFIPWEL